MLELKPNELHIVARLAVADPQVIAETLVYEQINGQVEVLEALSKLLECNRNEAGKNISAVVATATLPVNRQESYLFNEEYFIARVCQYLSVPQIEQLLQYNTQNLNNPEPCDEIKLVREVFGKPEIIKTGEGNSFLAYFLRIGKAFASEHGSQISSAKPVIDAVTAPNLGVCMLSMCLKQGFLPLMRHDGSHIVSGFNTSVQGEIFNQTYDFGVNALAQYGVVPTVYEQYLNRRAIYSFCGLPEQLQDSFQRDWKDYVDASLEVWRLFLLRHPEYVEKWGFSDFLDENMRMVKPDGSPIISEQTGEQQIPVIDYTDVAVLRELEDELLMLLTDEEVTAPMPYDLLYTHILDSLEALAQEHILRDGAPRCFVNGLYDACGTNSSAAFVEREQEPSLDDLSDFEPCKIYNDEKLRMQTKRSFNRKNGLWSGYFVDCGPLQDQGVWVTENSPCLHVLYPNAITIYRVTLPLSLIEESLGARTFFGSAAFLVDSKEMVIDSTLSLRDESKIPVLEKKRDNIVPSMSVEFY